MRVTIGEYIVSVRPPKVETEEGIEVFCAQLGTEVRAALLADLAKREARSGMTLAEFARKFSLSYDVLYRSAFRHGIDRTGVRPIGNRGIEVDEPKALAWLESLRTENEVLYTRLTGRTPDTAVEAVAEDAAPAEASA